jgi:hypothetical protein
MRRIIRRAGLVLLPVMALGLGQRAEAVSVLFSQLDWLSDSGGYTQQNSDWGRIDLQFGASDIGLFGSDGNGHLVTFINLTTDTSSFGGSSGNWAVQNAPIVINSIGDLSGRLADGFTFSLTTAPSLNVPTMNIGLSFAPTTSLAAPTISSSAAVNDISTLTGGFADPSVPMSGGAGQAAPNAAQNEACFGATDKVGLVGKIQKPDSSVPAINEGNNGCAPGSAARSLHYLQANGSLTIAEGPQSTYNLLYSFMSTTSTNGTTKSNFKSGKDIYDLVSPELQITTTQTGGTGQDFINAINALNNGADIEAMIYWGKNAQNQSMGGHAAFISQITQILDSSGNVKGYQVTIIDDGTQGNGNASNTKHILCFDASGNLENYGTGARMIGFQTEIAVPEPGTLAALVTLAGAVLVRRRRDKRKST